MFYIEKKNFFKKHFLKNFFFFSVKCNTYNRLFLNFFLLNFFSHFFFFFRIFNYCMDRFFFYFLYFFIFFKVRIAISFHYIFLFSLRLRFVFFKVRFLFLEVNSKFFFFFFFFRNKDLLSFFPDQSMVFPSLIRDAIVFVSFICLLLFFNIHWSNWLFLCLFNGNWFKQIGLPFQRRNRETVLRGPHIDKKSRSQFEQRIFSNIFFFPIFFSPIVHFFFSKFFFFFENKGISFHVDKYFNSIFI